MTLPRTSSARRWMALAAVTLAAGPAAARLQAQTPPAPAEGAPLFSPVTWERLVNAADEPHNWLMYNGTLDSQRFSRLDRIDRTNVGGLELKWAHHIPQLDRAETTPLVVDGVMFITESPSNVVAGGRRHGKAVLALRPSPAGRSADLLRPQQPRGRDSRRPALHEHPRRPSRRHRRPDGRPRVEPGGRRPPERVQQDRRPPSSSRTGS